MGRTLGVLIGAAAGVLLAGITAGVLIPILPSEWRSEGLTWAGAALVVAASITAALVLSAPRRG